MYLFLEWGEKHSHCFAWFLSAFLEYIHTKYTKAEDANMFNIIPYMSCSCIKRVLPSRVIAEKKSFLSISVIRNKSIVHNLTACVHWESQNFPHFGLSRDFPLCEYRCFNSVTAHRRRTWLDWHLRNTPMCSACQIHIVLFLKWKFCHGLTSSFLIFGKHAIQ